jgi:phosphoglycolate phosphatase-like HAD superfamily hydrolase
LNPSSHRLQLFLDDGGVLNDNRKRRPEWVRLIREFMPARLGGAAEQWAAANRGVMSMGWTALVPEMSTFASYRALEQAYALSWMSKMCNAMGMECPPDSEAIATYRDLGVYVAERADAAIEGVADAVRSLHHAGYMLRMASGTASWELRGILGQIGILDAFSGLYGPDLVDHVKYGPRFYELIFADAGVEPGGALVVESDLECCNWAREASAQAVWVDGDGAGEVTSLAELTHALLEGA